MRFTLAMLFLGSGFAISAAGPGDEPARKELAKLQGTWKLVAVEIGGQAFEYPDDVQLRWVVEDTRVTRMDDGKLLFALTVDPTAKPKTLDLTRMGTERSMEAIYSLSEDTWRICINPATDGARERPAEFATKDKPGWKIWLLKRDKQ